MLYNEMNAGNLQPPLNDCSGNRLGAAKVPTCDQTQNWITQAITKAYIVRHDTTLTGSGTCDSPLGINETWLTAFIDNEIDNHGINTASGSGLSGNGSKASPLALDIQHDGSLVGAGTAASKLELNANHDTSLDGTGKDGDPLKVDTTWLAAQMDGHASHVSPDSGIDGDGSADNPFSLDVQHDASLTGKGTKADPLELAIQHGDGLDGDGSAADPLTIDTDWLKEQIDADAAAGLSPTSGVAPATETEDGTLPTTIVGGTTSVLGTPDGYVVIADGYIIPVYKIAGA